MHGLSINCFCDAQNMQGLNGTLEPYLGRETLCCSADQADGNKYGESCPKSWDYVWFRECYGITISLNSGNMSDLGIVDMDSSPPCFWYRRINYFFQTCPGSSKQIFICTDWDVCVGNFAVYSWRSRYQPSSFRINAFVKDPIVIVAMRMPANRGLDLLQLVYWANRFRYEPI